MDIQTDCPWSPSPPSRRAAAFVHLTQHPAYCHSPPSSLTHSLTHTIHCQHRANISDPFPPPPLRSFLCQHTLPACLTLPPSAIDCLHHGRLDKFDQQPQPQPSAAQQAGEWLEDEFSGCSSSLRVDGSSRRSPHNAVPPTRHLRAIRPLLASTLLEPQSVAAAVSSQPTSPHSTPLHSTVAAEHSLSRRHSSPVLSCVVLCCVVSCPLLSVSDLLSPLVSSRVWSLRAFVVYVGWLLLHFVLYLTVPASEVAGVTLDKQGNRLTYPTNGQLQQNHNETAPVARL